MLKASSLFVLIYLALSSLFLSLSLFTFNHTLILTLISLSLIIPAHKHPNGKTIGISRANWEAIKEAIPSVAVWLARKYGKDFAHARPEVCIHYHLLSSHTHIHIHTLYQLHFLILTYASATITTTVQVQAQVRRKEQVAKEKRKLSKHEKKVSTTVLNIGWQNMESSLCNFFTFWQILDSIYMHKQQISSFSLSFTLLVILTLFLVLYNNKKQAQCWLGARSPEDWSLNWLAPMLLSSW